eukprot:GFYU01000228.1.p1 GENE.GFYU01000228.1~~GFYU01000228.1.p1  ORF type:complete len:632 (+),score=171.38 GFYU01000228.1:182-2077(+)
MVDQKNGNMAHSHGGGGGGIGGFLSSINPFGHSHGHSHGGGQSCDHSHGGGGHGHGGYEQLNQVQDSVELQNAGTVKLDYVPVLGPDGKVTLKPKEPEGEDGEGCDGTKHEIDIMKACQFGMVEKARELLSTDPENVHAVDEEGISGFHIACRAGHTDIARMFVDREVELDYQGGSNKCTALMWACASGKMEIIKMLVEAGASVSLQDNFGWSAVHWAVQNNQVLTAYYLLEKCGADLEQHDNDGHSPIQWAAYYGHTGMVQFLLKRGADINYQDPTGCAPIHWAALKNKPLVACILIERGCDMSLKDTKGCLPSGCAFEKGLEDYGKGLQAFEAAAESGKERPPFTELTPLWAPKDKPVNLGINGMQKIFVASVFVTFASYVVFLFDSAPVLASLVTVFCSYMMVFCYWKAATVNPGVVVGQFAVDELEDMLNASFNKTPINVCHTCEVRRPIRSKHCSLCDRCIPRFDHHCPWVNACVAEHNHKWFWLYIFFECCCHGLFLYYASAHILKDPSNDEITVFAWLMYAISNHIILALVIGWNILIGGFCLLLTSAQTWMIMIGVTTNEYMNSHRYHYLKSEGKYCNAYDLGVIGNLREFFSSPHNKRCGDWTRMFVLKPWNPKYIIMDDTV